MNKKWKDVKVGDIMKDGSRVTQVHRTHPELCCKITYDNTQEFTCAYNHVLLIDVSKLPKEAKEELDQFCTFVPLEESYDITSEEELTLEEKAVVEKFCYNEEIPVEVTPIVINAETEIYDFHFDKVKRVYLKQVVVKQEPQKVDENTYWLTCKGMDYLMGKYDAKLYCNGMIINKIELVGELPCFCISTDTGKYET